MALLQLTVKKPDEKENDPNQTCTFTFRYEKPCETELSSFVSDRKTVNYNNVLCLLRNNVLRFLEEAKNPDKHLEPLPS